MHRYLLTLWAVITLSWQANTESDLSGYKLYSRPSTVQTFTLMSTMHKQTNVSVKVDGRRNWYFYLTAFNTSKQESLPSNIVYVDRGY